MEVAQSRQGECVKEREREREIDILFESVCASTLHRSFKIVRKECGDVGGSLNLNGTALLTDITFPPFLPSIPIWRATNALATKYH